MSNPVPSLQLLARNMFGAIPLMYACANGHHEVVEVLLEHHSAMHQVLAANVRGVTPLMIACWNGHVSVVQALARLDMRAQCRMRSFNDDGGDCGGLTPLDFALVRNQHECARAMFSALLSPNALAPPVVPGPEPADETGDETALKRRRV